MSEEAESYLEHMCQLDIESTAPNIVLSKIICTIGTSSRSVDILAKMMEAGMNVARLNFSHSSHMYHARTIKKVREASKIYSEKMGMMYPIAIALDTKGPEIRVGLIEGSSTAQIGLTKDDTIKLTTNPEYAEKGNKDIIYVDYANIVNVVYPGDRVLFDVEDVSLIVKEISGDTLVCTIENGGHLGANKILNLCHDLPAVTEKDKADLKFGVEQDVDMIFASYVGSADTVREIRKVLGEKGKNIKIISKIENQQGLQNLDEIIAASDGIMVARSDLGINLLSSKLFLEQNYIISRCNKARKPVICATHMLASIIKISRPTGEISDVANAVLGGADCVMLAGETAKGKYVLKCISEAANTCKEAEAAVWHKNLFTDLVSSISGTIDATHAIAIAAVEASTKVHAAAIIVITTSGRSAHMVAMFRPQCPIIAVTKFPQVARQAHLFRGILPLVYTEPALLDWLKDVETRVQFGIRFGKERGFIQSGDAVVIVTEWKQGSGFTNTMRILYAVFDDSDDQTDEPNYCKLILD